MCIVVLEPQNVFIKNNVDKQKHLDMKAPKNRRKNFYTKRRNK